MNKKCRSWIINIFLTIAVLTTGILMMGAYDPACGEPRYSEMNFVYDFDGLNTSTGNGNTTIVNVENGTAEVIPVKVVLTMQNDYTLDNVYGENGTLYPTYNTALMMINPDIAFVNPGMSFGVTSNIITSGSAVTSGASITYTADLNVLSTVPTGDYNVPVAFKIYNKLTGSVYTLSDTIYIHIYDFEITTSELLEGTIGEPYSNSLTLLGGTPPYSWSAADLQQGLNINSSTGEITGIPTETGLKNVAVTVTDSSDPVKTCSAGFELFIAPQPAIITTASLSGGTAGSAYSQTIQTSGGLMPFLWGATGLPAGLTMNSATGEISGTPTQAGTYNVQIGVMDSYGSSDYTTLSLVIAPQAPTPDQPSDNSSGGHSSGSHSSQNNPVIKDDRIEIKTTRLDKGSGIALTQTVDSGTLNKAFENAATNENGIKTVEVIVSAQAGAKGYESTLPSSFLASGDGSKAVALNTEVAVVTVPDNMLSETEVSGQTISLTVSEGDKAKLDAATQEQIGDRPVIEISMRIDGKQTPWSNDDARVTISIPYKPTAEELKDPEHITVWYIDGEGKAFSVPSGKYDPKTGCVTFETTHFSKYAIAFVKKIFNDLDKCKWAQKSIEVLAAKGIISGSSETAFNPSGKITRADFLVLLTKTLGLNTQADSNFIDVKKGKYYYDAVGTAKKLGIVTGSENNTFIPEEPISRQDMMVMTERAIKLLKSDTQAPATDNLDQFSDKSFISDYALDSVSGMVKEGFVKGSGGKINPLANTTRAEAAVLLYDIYNWL